MSIISLKNFTFVLLSSILFSLAPLLLTLAYSHFGSYEDSAQLGLALAICAPLQLFFSMQHGLSILAGNLPWRRALEIRGLLLFPYLIISYLVSLLLSNYTVLVFSLFRIGDFLYEPAYYERIRASAGRQLFSEGLIRFLLLGFVVFGCVYHRFDLIQTIVAMALINIAFVLINFRNTLRTLSFSLVSLRSSGVFVGVSALLFSISINVPRYMLSNSEAKDLAAYSNVLTLVMGGTIFFGSINNVLFSRKAKDGMSGILSFLRLSLMFCLCGILFSLIFVFFDGYFSRWLIKLFLGPSYSEYYSLIFGFSVFYFILYLQNSLNCAYVYIRFDRYFAVGTGGLLVFLLVSLYGLLTSGRPEMIVWAVNANYFLFCLVMLLFFPKRGLRV